MCRNDPWIGLVHGGEGDDLVDLVGTGRRLTSADLLAAANKVGVDVATIRAVIEVETAGAGFDAKKRLKLLFEPHVFYSNLVPDPSGVRQSNKALHTPNGGPPLSPSFKALRSNRCCHCHR